MKDFEQVLMGAHAAAPPSHVLEGLGDAEVDRIVPGAPHSIYSELWHITFWQERMMDWVGGRETPVPEHAAGSFPTAEDRGRESWSALCARFFKGLEQVAAATGDEALLLREIRCPSLPGMPVRVMTARRQMEDQAAHNAYHFGRVVLLRQMMGTWPPASGGSTW